jgi:hypothetical protein
MHQLSSAKAVVGPPGVGSDTFNCTLESWQISDGFHHPLTNVRHVGMCMKDRAALDFAPLTGITPIAGLSVGPVGGKCFLRAGMLQRTNSVCMI